MKPRTFLFAAGLFAALASPLPAQQAAPAATSTAPVTAPATSLPGPRVRDELRRVQPKFSASREPLLRHKSTETITISTIVLVLLVVLVVLLVA